MKTITQPAVITSSPKSSLSTPWLYFAATFGWTWLFWGVAILMGATLETASGGILLLVGVGILQGLPLRCERAGTIAQPARSISSL